ncbi:DeoR/GlpR family DNA-binding transcription regulator [Hyalangium rubrum]|uniref:DeoR/GlpR family DNA-binding transcription regulator n=1 Tax=Hyalangium rubrum TaxID=3103134 RepID=A0ABU5H9K2_9BACT|nr:DeoR/GlpR family DNA-binding transcription regulator [Hyalangium sp. s54d21]MDY7230166.1 DeoR/GlpR family DNA-binding transcription regulator [Hyalangium sp. s54d21]
MTAQNPEDFGSALLPEERRRLILERLSTQGRVFAADLCGLLRVSEDTVRRDLRELDEAGLLRRVHGGALPRIQMSPSHQARVGLHQSEKQALAEVAAGLVQPGQVLFIDGGTTTLEVARHLPKDLRATVVTVSPPVALALAEYPGLEVRLVGGRLHPEALTVVGAETVEALRQVRADLCLMGVCSLHIDGGITASYAEEAATKRVMVQNAAETVAVFTADKLGTLSPFVVAPAERLGTLVTEARTPESVLAPFRKLNLRILTA